MRAICRSDLNQLGASARHNVRHAKSAANFYEFTSGDDRLATVCERVEAEKNSGGVVVDDGRVFRAREVAQEGSDMVVAVATLTLSEVKFERDGAAHSFHRGFDRRLGEHRPPEICMQHRSRQVEHRAQH